MVALSENAQRRLTIQTVEIATNTTAIRSLDWDRDRFDIEFGLQNGTTYNSYLIKGEKNVLVDTSHQKFRDLYLNALKSLVNLKAIDYIIVSHTEPDHSGVIEDVLQLAPRATVLASKIALQFLDNLVHDPFSKRIVKSGDRINIGKGHEIEFVSHSIEYEFYSSCIVVTNSLSSHDCCLADLRSKLLAYSRWSFFHNFLMISNLSHYSHLHIH